MFFHHEIVSLIPTDVAGTNFKKLSDSAWFGSENLWSKIYIFETSEPARRTGRLLVTLCAVFEVQKFSAGARLFYQMIEQPQIKEVAVTMIAGYDTRWGWKWPEDQSWCKPRLWLQSTFFKINFHNWSTFESTVRSCIVSYLHMLCEDLFRSRRDALVDFTLLLRQHKK